MCRLYGFHANELTKVECSLVHAQNALLSQSRRDEIGRRHADGWGIACYGDLDIPGHRIPELIRHKTAAFDDMQFSHQAETMYAQTVVAHVRLATVGYVGPLNSHPFIHDGWTFAHNGTLPCFERLEPQLAEEAGRFQDGRLGSTDSEQFFLWLLNHFCRDGIDLFDPDFSAIERSIAVAMPLLDRRCRQLEPTETPRLTFMLTNGQFIFGCRWNNSLHWLDRQGVQDCEICGIPHIRHSKSEDYRAVVFASEPITDEAWEALPDHTLYSINDDFQRSVSNLSKKHKSPVMNPDDEPVDMSAAREGQDQQTGPPAPGSHQEPPGSHQEQLRGELTTLHELLEGVDEVAADTKQAMQAVAADIHRLLDQESSGDAWSQVGTRWHQAVLNFESQHPRLTQAVDQITGLLANVGF